MVSGLISDGEWAYQRRLISFGLSATASLSATVGLSATVSGLIGDGECIIGNGWYRRWLELRVGDGKINTTIVSVFFCFGIFFV